MATSESVEGPGGRPTAGPPTGHAGLLDGFFRLQERGTDLRTEALAGLATFLTMSYIVFVNPAILSAAKMPFAAVAVCTALAAAIFTAAMGLIANYRSRSPRASA